MKGCSISVTIWEIQTKTTMWYHLTPVRMATIKKSTNNTGWRRHGKKGTLLHCWWECKLIQSLWRTVQGSLKNPAIPLLGIYPEKTTILKDTYTPMFTVAISIIAKARKQSKCPSTNEWIKMGYIHTMEWKGNIWVSCSKVDESRASYTEWSQSEKTSIKY